MNGHESLNVITARRIGLFLWKNPVRTNDVRWREQGVLHGRDTEGAEGETYFEFFSVSFVSRR